VTPVASPVWAGTTYPQTEVTTLEGFAGPGGLSEAARMLGITRHLGIDINRDACATATAAGHQRIQADIRTLNPNDYPHVTGAIWTPPCPTFSTSGKQSGLKDYRTILHGVTLLGDSQAGITIDDAYADVCSRVADPRTALVLETLRFALRLPGLQWFVAEQVPAVHGIWEEMCAELAATHDFESCNVVTLRADDFGAATRRARVFLIATRHRTPDFTGMPIRAHWSCGRYEAPRLHLPTAVAPLAQVSMAAVLDWPAGVQIRTRGNRRTPGGNLFSADGPSLGLTEKARSWTREDRPGHALTPAEAGVLQGFPRDYPWQGSRSSQFLQVADTVSPLVGAAVLGAATGLPWQDAIRQRIEQLYGPSALQTAVAPAQLDLLAGVA
jgi:DNA (cytosine-5)-methyltransferase 1